MFNFFKVVLTNLSPLSFHMCMYQLFDIYKKTFLEFWIYRLRRIDILTIRLPTLEMKYHSIYAYLLWFISSLFWRFQHTDPVHILIYLYLTSFFIAIVYAVYISYFEVQFFLIETGIQLTFLYWPFILQTLLNSLILEVIL